MNKFKVELNQQLNCSFNQLVLFVVTDGEAVPAPGAEEAQGYGGPQEDAEGMTPGSAERAYCCQVPPAMSSPPAVPTRELP